MNKPACLPSHFLWPILLLLICFSGVVVSAEPPGMPVKIHLKDGSKIIGVTQAEGVPFETEVGKLEFKMGVIDLIEQGPDDAHATLTLRNGDGLKGTVSEDAIKVEALFGVVELKWAWIQTFTVEATPGPIPRALQEKAVAWYPLDGDAKDHAGTADGRPVATTWVKNRFGEEDRAVGFNGTNAFVDISRMPIQQAYTFSLWANLERSSTSGVLLGMDGSYWLIAYTNRVRCSTKAGSSPGGNWTGGPDLQRGFIDGQWHHFAWSRSKAGLHQLYIDGELEIEGRFNPGAIPHARFGRHLGRTKNNLGRHGGYFRGAMDDVRVFGEPLTAREVVQLYKEKTK